MSLRDPSIAPPFEAPRLILASASPRRRELIALLGLPHEARTSQYEEPAAPTNPVVIADFVMTLAVGKARDVASRAEAGSLVLGADTEVTLEDGEMGTPLGKPVDREHARRMLRSLSGRAHVVSTGVALVRSLGAGETAEPMGAVTQTRVRLRALTDEMIESYLETGEPFDKAGGYGAQGYAAPFIEGIEGDFFNVVGLPLCTVGQLLERAGVAWWRARSQAPPLLG